MLNLLTMAPYHLCTDLGMTLRDCRLLLSSHLLLLCDVIFVPNPSHLSR